MKKALIVATVSGFLAKFELHNVALLQDMGYEVHYAANENQKIYEYDEEELRRRHIQMHSIPIQKSPFQIAQNWKALKELEKIIIQEDINLVHCHTPVGGLLGRLSAHRIKNRNVKVIYTAHGFHFYGGCSRWKYVTYHSIEKYLARFTDAIVTINSEDYQNAGMFRLKDGGHVFQIPGVGLDRNKFSPCTQIEREQTRARLQVMPGQVLLFSVGELNENKNHRIVLKTLYQMKQQGIDLNHYRYVICGEGSYREELQDCITKWKLQDVVTLYGYCEHPEKLLGAADLFLFPSRREGLGMAALEALSCEVPVIAAENRGSREYIQPGQNGYFFSWDDPDSLIGALGQWENLTPAQKCSMRRRSRESVCRFDQKCADSIMREAYRFIDKKIEMEM